MPIAQRSNDRNRPAAPVKANPSKSTGAALADAVAEIDGAVGFLSVVIGIVDRVPCGSPLTLAAVEVYGFGDLLDLIKARMESASALVERAVGLLESANKGKAPAAPAVIS